MSSDSNPARLPRVGVIGLGGMGSRMAGRLLNAGYHVGVYNRTSHRADELGQFGAVVAGSPRALAEASDIVLSSVADDSALAQVMYGADGALAGDEQAIVKAVAHSCRMKAEIVARDERETGDRALLNLGHTFGHALEAATGFSGRLVHGEGVAIGMALAFQLSVKLGLCPGQDAERFIRHLKAVGLPSSIGDIAGTRPGAGELIRHMAHDKKVTDGKLTFILLRGLGQAYVTRDVPLEAVKSVLTD